MFVLGQMSELINECLQRNADGAKEFILSSSMQTCAFGLVQILHPKG